MKILLITIAVLLSQSLYAQDNPNIWISNEYIYFVDSLLNTDFELIEKFERTVEDPLDDPFWGLTPSSLEENYKRYNFIVKNENGDTHLFAVDKLTYDTYNVNDTFQVKTTLFTLNKISDLGVFNKKELDFVMMLKD